MYLLDKLFLLPLRVEYKRKLQELLRNIDDSYEFFYIPQGLGDLLYFCMYLHSYRIKNPDIHTALIVTKDHLSELVELFKADVDLILRIDESYYRIGDIPRFTYLYPRIYDAASPQNNLSEAVRNAMSLPKNAERLLPKVEDDPSIIQRIVKKDEVVRVAMIAPDANSCSALISDHEWLDVAKLLQEKGYTVVFNIKESKRFIGYANVFLPIKETIQFCNACDLFIGYRSGLCDVIAAFCQCKQIVIYPNDRQAGELNCVEGYDSDPNQRYMEYCSLNRIFPEAKITEYIYSKDEYIQRLEERIDG